MNWQHILNVLHGEMASGIVATAMIRLGLLKASSVLGGVTSLGPVELE
jgi:hypothetical protein